MLHNPDEIPREAREEIESYVGPIAPDERVSVMLFTPNVVPDEETRRAALEAWRKMREEAAAKTNEVPEEEVNAAIEEAIQYVRAQRRERERRTGRPDVVRRKTSEVGPALRDWVRSVCSREMSDEECVRLSVELEPSTSRKVQEEFHELYSKATENREQEGISVDEADRALGEAMARGRPDSRQSIRDWTSVYEGLTDKEIEAIDREVKTRANLSRHLPY